MADVVLLGIYASKSALDSAHSSGNTKGDSYLVGTKCPYDIYSWSGSAFTKGAKCGTLDTLDIGINDVNQDIPLSDVIGKTLVNSREQNVKLIPAIGKNDLGQFDVVGA